MNRLSVAVFFITLGQAFSRECNIVCPLGDAKMECGLNLKTKTYAMFPSKCAMAAYSECYNVEFVQTPLKYCIKSQSQRRMYGESCPVFCPSHYRPVCGASKFRSYVYRTFTNGCYMDMLNCRGDDNFSGFVEVPLEYCQNHGMKNIYREQVVVSNLRDYEEY